MTSEYDFSISWVVPSCWVMPLPETTASPYIKATTTTTTTTTSTLQVCTGNKYIVAVPGNGALTKLGEQLK